MPRKATPKPAPADPVAVRVAAIRAIQLLHAAFNKALDELRIAQRVVGTPNIPLEEVRHRLNDALADMDERIIELDYALDALEEAQGEHH